MTLLVISFLVIALAALGMAVGAIAGRRPITAGCARLGGLLDGPADCEACSDPCGVRRKDRDRR
jgi:hypothetical protein